MLLKLEKTLLGLAVVLMACAVHAKVYRAGLKGGYVNSFDQNNYHKVEIPDIGVFKGIEAASLKAGETGVKTYPPIWVNNRTWTYHGQMYFNGGTYYFAEQIDDRAYIAIDGVQKMNDGTWNNTAVTDAIVLSEGWHDVVFRFANGGGGAGLTYDTTLDKNGKKCGFGWTNEANEKPTDMSSFMFAEDPGDGSLFRCAEEDANYIQLNGLSIASGGGGYVLNVTSLAPSPATLTVYYGETAGMSEDPASWASSVTAEFAAGETKDVVISGEFTRPPRYQMHLTGVGTTLAEGEGVKFWQWDDVSACTMAPTVAPALTAVSAAGADFIVALGYDKTIDGMAAPAIALKAYYGTEDFGADAEAWGEGVLDFGAENAAGDVTCSLTGLSADTVYFVRFAAKTAESDWMWSDCLTLSTGGVFLKDFPATLFENDPTELSFKVCRPEGTTHDAQTVYLTYDGAADKVEGLPESVTLEPGVAEIAVPFAMIDNDADDGEKTLTIVLAENEFYTRGEPASVTMSVKDDETAAEDVTWVGLGEDPNWETPANWEPARVPNQMDTVVFTDSGLANNATVTISSAAACRVLKFSRLGAMTLGGEGSLKLGGIVREDVEGDEGRHTLSVPLTLFADPDTVFLEESGWCVLNIAGSDSLWFNSDMTKVGDAKLWKTGPGSIEFRKQDNTWNGRIRVWEGSAYGRARHCYKGTAEAGGGTESAKFEFTENNSTAGVTCKAYANGYVYVRLGVSGEATDFYAYDGGRIKTDSIYWKHGYMTGGKIEGGTWWTGGWTQSINSYASATMSEFTPTVKIGGYDAATVYVEDGEAPVDLLLSGVLTESGSDQTLTKKGAGVVKSTKKCDFKGHFVLEAGVWYADNPGEYGLGTQETTVKAGAKLGGTGRVGMEEVKSYATVALSDGNETKYATLSPGTIDNATGEHIYGTLTLGQDFAHNRVTLGKYAHLEAGLGAREGSASPHDKLFVYGNLEIGENCVLDLKTNSTTETKLVKSGEYTIIEADAIVGTFAKIILPEGANWRVHYNATVPDGGTDLVVTSVSVKVSNGFAVFVR